MIGVSPSVTRIYTLCVRSCRSQPARVPWRPSTNSNALSGFGSSTPCREFLNCRQTRQHLLWLHTPQKAKVKNVFNAGKVSNAALSPLRTVRVRPCVVTFWFGQFVSGKPYLPNFSSPGRSIGLFLIRTKFASTRRKEEEATCQRTKGELKRRWPCTTSALLWLSLS